MTEKRPVKIGMMSFAHMHAASYASSVNAIPDAELVGISDVDADRGRKMAEQFNADYCGSHESLLSKDVDAVIICSENALHKELTIMAAEAGKHVMCEKPLAPTLEDGYAMIEACKKHNVKLQTAFPCRYGTATVQAREAVVSGEIGKTLAMTGTNHGRCPWGWFVDIQLSGGGAVIDHTVHVVDLMRWFMGAEVTEVYAEISNLMLHKDFDDTGMLSLQFDNGVFATLDTSWSRPPSFPTWGDVNLSVLGDKGVVDLRLFDQKINHYSDENMSCAWQPWGDNIDYGLVKSFVDAVANDTPVEVTGEDGLAAAAVALAAYESAKRSRSVKLSEIGYH